VRAATHTRRPTARAHKQQQKKRAGPITGSFGFHSSSYSRGTASEALCSPKLLYGTAHPPSLRLSPSYSAAPHETSLGSTAHTLVEPSSPSSWGFLPPARGLARGNWVE